MLVELHVRDLALIDEAELGLGPGLNVLTGETGAGKTVLVSALRLLLGDRADAGAVRAGAAEAVVEGLFETGEEQRVVRRRVSAEGRSRCQVDGEMVTVTALAEALGPLVEIHGQHDHQALLSVSSHAAFLDRFAGTAGMTALGAYRSALQAAVEAARERDRIGAALADRDSREEHLRYALADIDSVAPRPGEDAAIEARLPRLRHGERLAEATAAAYEALRGEGGATDRLGEAIAALRGAAGLDPELDALAGSLDEGAALLDDAVARTRAYREGVDRDPAALEECESRLAALTALKRKHGPTLDDAIAARERAAAELEALGSGAEGLAAAEARVSEAEAALADAAAGLRSARAEVAGPFQERLAASSAELAMPSARFVVAMEPLPRGDWGPDGPDRVEFLFSGSAGENPRPLARIASGGELSRVMLALKGVLGEADPVPVLVFDEVDAGIGGTTATAVGARLKELSRGRQVIAVTHLAQVAVFADRHLVVTKSLTDDRDTTSVAAATGDARVAEIARMLAGSGSDASLEHARELLAAVGAAGV